MKKILKLTITVIASFLLSTIVQAQTSKHADYPTSVYTIVESIGKVDSFYMYESSPLSSLIQEIKPIKISTKTDTIVKIIQEPDRLVNPKVTYTYGKGFLYEGELKYTFIKKDDVDDDSYVKNELQIYKSIVIDLKSNGYEKMEHSHKIIYKKNESIITISNETINDNYILIFQVSDERFKIMKTNEVNSLITHH